MYGFSVLLYQLHIIMNWTLRVFMEIGIGEGGIGPGLLPWTEQNKWCEINQIPT